MWVGMHLETIAPFLQGIDRKTGRKRTGKSGRQNQHDADGRTEAWPVSIDSENDSGADEVNEAKVETSLSRNKKQTVDEQGDSALDQSEMDEEAERGAEEQATHLDEEDAEVARPKRKKRLGKCTMIIRDWVV